MGVVLATKVMYSKFLSFNNYYLVIVISYCDLYYNFIDKYNGVNIDFFIYNK